MSIAKIKKKHTKRDKWNNVWLVIDHQSFMLRPSLGDSDAENRAHAEWLRDQLAIALQRLIDHEVSALVSRVRSRIASRVVSRTADEGRGEFGV